MSTHTLLLRLAAPMQSWGGLARGTLRSTEPAPTKSGVIGMIANALGYERTDDVSELAALEYGVRIDAPGVLQTDFQVTRERGAASGKLSDRHYLCDAVFLVAFSGELQLLECIQGALAHPARPLYLGRRSCPPDGPVRTWLLPLALEQALRAHEWQGPARVLEAAKRRGEPVEAALIVDAPAVRGLEMGEELRDMPLSFDPAYRRYGRRRVTRPAPVTVFEPDVVPFPGASSAHDPMDLLVEEETAA